MIHTCAHALVTGHVDTAHPLGAIDIGKESLAAGDRSLLVKIYSTVSVRGMHRCTYTSYTTRLNMEDHKT